VPHPEEAFPRIYFCHLKVPIQISKFSRAGRVRHLRSLSFPLASVDLFFSPRESSAFLENERRIIARIKGSIRNGSSSSCYRNCYCRSRESAGARRIRSARAASFAFPDLDTRIRPREEKRAGEGRAAGLPPDYFPPTFPYYASARARSHGVPQFAQQTSPLTMSSNTVESSWSARSSRRRHRAHCVSGRVNAWSRA